MAAGYRLSQVAGTLGSDTQVTSADLALTHLNQMLEPNGLVVSECPEKQLLICVARRSLDAATAERLRRLLGCDLDWKYLLARADHHGLIPLLHFHLNAVARSSVPDSVMSQLRDANHKNIQSTLFLTGELLKVLEFLEQNGIRAIPFKGPTLAVQAYDDVGLRQFGDLDILVHKKDVRRVKELLTGRGFAPTPELTDAQQAAQLRFDCAYNLVNQQGLVLDVHWKLAERHFSFDIDIDRLWERLEPVTISGKEMLTLSSEDLLLVLCLHGFTHLWERLGWICDVASLIESRRDINWDFVLQNATTLGARRILSLGLYLAGDLLGASFPPEVSRSLQPDSRVKKLAEQIREQLFTGRAVAGVLAEAGMLVNLRERKSDRLKACLRLAASPRSYDWMFFSVPDSLFFLYYLVRPLRLAGKYSAKLLRSSDRQEAKVNGKAGP